MKVLFVYALVMYAVILIVMTAGFIHWHESTNGFGTAPDSSDIEHEPPPVSSSVTFIPQAPPDQTDENGDEAAASEPTPAPDPTPSPDPTPAPSQFIDYFETGGLLELPVRGASGYAAVSVSLQAHPQSDAESLLTLSPGQAFTILDEDGEWWYVESGVMTGWVPHRYCLINLPDVIPSIVYDITNAYSSRKRSSGYDIPNITGQSLYDAYDFNSRLNRDEFIVPAMYPTAIKLAAAQRAALADGRTIILFEAFRPRETQSSVVSNFRQLIAENPVVSASINTPPWSISWFISTGVSNHQRGAAVDISLGSIVSYEKSNSGDYSYTVITEHTEYVMPTAIHELSPLAIIFASPVSSSSPTAWIGVPLVPTVTEGVVLMQGYLADAGFTPISSEWWHFNDLDSISVADNIGSQGNFYISTAYSVAPLSIT